MKPTIIPALNIDGVRLNRYNPLVHSNTRKIAKAKYAVLERDNFRCTVCGKTDELTIYAHINPIRGKNRGNAKIFALDMCKVECIKCHLSRESEYIPQKLNRWQYPAKPKPIGESSTNILPYVPTKITIIETSDERCYVPNHSVEFEAKLGITGQKYTKWFW